MRGTQDNVTVLVIDLMRPNIRAVRTALAVIAVARALLKRALRLPMVRADSRKRLLPRQTAVM